MDASQLHSAMGDPNQGSASSSSRRRRNREIETVSLEIRNYPRDLVHSFLSTDPNRQQSIESGIEEQGEEIEFNLGLSLGGRFGVDKPHRGLIRSSSIAGSLPSVRPEEEEEESAPPPLSRTSSLPSVTEEEWRRRKATLRRMEAKRRRSEKQRSLKEAAAEERETGLKLNPGSGPGPGLPNPTRQGGIQGKGGFFRSLQGLLAHQEQQLKQGCSQGSGESLGGGSSSCASELDSKTHQGSGSFGEARSPAPPASASGTKYGEGSSRQPETQDHRKKEAGTSKGEEMPSVFTIGDGPNGRKVEGILYRYSKGEEVRIMCICHGSFFSPAEFVKHAGCSDVEHPLRHIVVNPSSSPF